jgi:hypothetical protein
MDNMPMIPAESHVWTTGNISTTFIKTTRGQQQWVLTEEGIWPDVEVLSFVERI